MTGINLRFRIYSLALPNVGSEAGKTPSERIRIINDQLKGKANELNPSAWSVIRSTLTAIEIDHELIGEESVEVDNILTAVLMETHKVSTGAEGKEYHQR